MAADSDKQKLREEMQDMFGEMLELHKRMLLVAIELHKAMEEDGDPRGISNSNEFLSLMKQQRTLLILGMVHKANMADSEEECGKLIPFPVRATKANLEATVRHYIPQNIERLAKEHADIMRMAKVTGYFAWSLPKSCVSHVKTTTVTTYECANCNVLCNAKENFAGNGFDFLHRPAGYLPLPLLQAADTLDQSFQIRQTNSVQQKPYILTLYPSVQLRAGLLHPTHLQIFEEPLAQLLFSYVHSLFLPIQLSAWLFLFLKRYSPYLFQRADLLCQQEGS